MFLVHGITNQVIITLRISFSDGRITITSQLRSCCFFSTEELRKKILGVTINETSRAHRQELINQVLFLDLLLEIN